MHAFTVRLQDRDFSPRQACAGLFWRGARCSWSMLGGPDRATLTASGEPGALEELLGCLRCPVELFDAAGQPVWWGYVWSVHVNANGASVRVGLDGMANAVSVRYPVGPAGAGELRWLRTAWAEDAAGIAEFGRMEHIAEAPSRCTAAEADALAASLLARMCRPAAALSPQVERASPKATLECRGWWHTLEWLYYGQAAGLEEHDDHAGECALGMGFPGPAGWFEPSTRRIWDLYGRWTPFRTGQRFRVAGTLLNNGDFAVAEGTARVPWSYTASTISFSSASSEMSDAAAGLLGLRRGDIILVSGSQSNDGWRRVETAFDGGARVTLTPGPQNDPAGGAITLQRGNSVVVDRALAVESAPAGATVSAQLRLAQRVQLAAGAGWPASRLALWLSRAGDPSDGPRAGFQADAGGAPTGVWLSYADVPPEAVSPNGGWVDVTLPTEVALSATVPRWLVVERTGAADPWSFYRVGVSSDCSYGRGAMWHLGGAWQSVDPAFELAFRCEGWQQHGEQLAAALSAAPFLTGVLVEPTPDLSGSPYRPGDERLSDVVAGLLASSGPGGALLCATVTRERNVRVEWAPDDVRWQIGSGGRLLDLWSAAPSPAYLPVGELAAIPSLFPSAGMPFAAAPFPTLRVEHLTVDLGTGAIIPS